MARVVSIGAGRNRPSMAFETAAVSASFEVVDSPVMSSFEIDSGSIVRFAEVTGTVVSSMMAVTHGATMVAGVAMVMVMVANTLMGGHSSSALARNWAVRYPTSISSSSAFKSGITSVFLSISNSGSTFDFFKALKVDVLQVSHSDVLHVGVIKSTLGTPEVASFFNDMNNFTRRRSNSDGTRWRDRFDNNWHVNRGSIPLVLSSAACSEANQEENNNSAE